MTKKRDPRKVWGEGMLTISDLAKVLPASERMLEGFIRDGSLKTIQECKSGTHYISARDLATFMAKKGYELPQIKKPTKPTKPVKQQRICFNSTYLIDVKNCNSFKYLLTKIREVLGALTDWDNPNAEKFLLDIRLEDFTISHQIILKTDRRKRIAWLVLFDFKLSGGVGEKADIVFIKEKNMVYSDWDKRLIAALGELSKRVKANTLHLIFENVESVTAKQKVGDVE